MSARPSFNEKRDSSDLFRLFAHGHAEQLTLVKYRRILEQSGLHCSRHMLLAARPAAGRNNE